MDIRADLHVHALLNTWMYGRDVAKPSARLPFFLPPAFNYVDYVRAYSAGIRLLFSVIYLTSLPWQNPIDQVRRLLRREQEQIKRSRRPEEALTRLIQDGEAIRES